MILEFIYYRGVLRGPKAEQCSGGKTILNCRDTGMDNTY